MNQDRMTRRGPAAGGKPKFKSAKAKPQHEAKARRIVLAHFTHRGNTMDLAG